ncbi:protein DEHYDRATION-INDUCED 195-like [Dorcoceras hygrometricum]|uniref:Protein DEHYDRATION-INDUCED 195-like n=1 Tax=Dorcoceras hygrometricum TaxID=472368 RepID=A0A2Z7B2A7_9LAMI|nr:protein DEHYDRATION-INDUCED 195-like [Dorcoceras hygrometricum]
MDLDFWAAARVHSARQTSAAIQSSRAKSSGTRGVGEDEGDEGVRAWFPCPFCYFEIEVPLLCSHLQEEHCFDLRNAVCPICAASLGNDPTGHFTGQHAHSIKRRKVIEKPRFRSNISTNIVRDFRDLSSCFATISLAGSSESSQDPFGLPFQRTVPPPVDPKHIHKDMISPYVDAASDPPSNILSVIDQVHKWNYNERRQRAAFIQELLGSTIL